MSGQRRLMPHRSAAEESVIWGPWMVRVGTEALHPADGSVQGWDYATPLQFECQVQIDVERFLASTGLDSLESVGIVATLDCSPSLYRSWSSVPAARVLLDDFLTLTVEADSSRVATSVELVRHAVLTQTLAPSEDGRAARRGSRLLTERGQKVLIEGAGGRFPTEALPFSALGREPAPWDLAIHYTDLHETFLGSVRLLVNSEHPAGLAALKVEHPEHETVVSVMRWDMVRRLLGHVVANEEDRTVLKEEFATDSVGGALDAMCGLYLKRSLPEVIADMEQGRAEWEPLLQARLGLMSAVH